MAKNKLIIQRHHIQYANEEHHQPEIVVPILKGEHWILTNLQRRKNISKGFIKSLKIWIAVNEDFANELSFVEKA